ncbi:6-phosphogluconate dehydrogenase, domain-containing protein isoform 2 [Cladophialophora immunda]|nr:6-phosphogluconate dehydrogenase, domain-containing protein isoform 2 [Cladophialophora immunda]
MSPGGDAETLKKIIPFLERVAAKDKQGRPCTACIGPAGSGHYVKMVHNGIEQGMMSAIAEVWFIMNRCLKMSYKKIADTFESWNESDPLRDNFLVAIGADINRTRDGEGNFVLANVLDKVVQDVDNSEGTGVWTCEETVRLHVPSPTIVSAHLFRLASADAAKRQRVNKAFAGGAAQPATIKLEVPHEKALPSFIEDLKLSLYAAFLCAFIQGLGIIKTKDREQSWNLDYRAILQIWRGGCIIQSDYISDLLDRVLSDNDVVDDLLSQDAVAAELGKCVASLKNVVLKSLAADAYIPSLSATLEYIKYSGATELPTQFMEAELDYFGAHSFDLKSEGPGKPLKGSHHYEWKPPRGIFGDKLDGSK